MTTPENPLLCASEQDAMRDRDLLARMHSGDEYAFNTLVRLYAEPLYRLAYVRAHDTQIAEDVVQDVFATVWDKRAQLDVHGNVQGYLVRAVRNRVFDVLRHRRSQERVEDLARLELAGINVVNDGELAIDAEELASVVAEALTTLSPRTREIFMLRRERGMSYDDIADALNVGVPTVRNQVSRATQVLLLALRGWRGM